MTTETVTTPQVTEPGDHEKFAHFVPKAELNDALITGNPVRALCGKMWTPTRDPKKFPICPDCKAIWEQMQDDDPNWRGI
jgi:hypothetical protein